MSLDGDDFSISQSYIFEPQLLYSSRRDATGLINIEHLHRNDECNAPKRPWMVAQNANTGMALFFQPTCKRWSCPRCGQVNAKRWIARAITGCKSLRESGNRVDFVTITSHEKLSAYASFRVWPLAWKKLHVRYRRSIAPGDPGAYLAVPERHQDGRLHTHAMMTGGLTKKWWKDNARECGMGYQSDVKEVADLGVGGYVGKYLGKTLAEIWPRGKRRVNTSQTWPTLPDLPHAEGWTFLTKPTDGELTPVLVDLSANGYTVFGVTTENAWALLGDLSQAVGDV